MGLGRRRPTRLRWRVAADAIVIDECADGGMRPAHRTIRIAGQPDLTKPHAEGVVDDEPADERAGWEQTYDES